MNDRSVSNILRLLSLFFVFTLIFTTPLAATAASKHRDIGGGKVFVFNPRTLSYTIYSHGEAVHSGHAVGGKGFCSDIGRRCRTPVGTFHIYAKEGPNFHSSKFPPPNGGAPMPWAMFFRGGYAIHGSNDVPDYNASHGCIRVQPSEARWMNTKFLPIGTKVVVLPY